MRCVFHHVDRATRPTKPWDNYKALPKQKPRGSDWERKWEKNVPFGRPYLASNTPVPQKKKKEPAPWHRQKAAPWKQRSRTVEQTEAADRARRQPSPRHGHNTCPWRWRDGYSGPGPATAFPNPGNTVTREVADSLADGKMRLGLVNLAASRKEAAETEKKTRMTQCPWAGGADETEGRRVRTDPSFGGNTPRGVSTFDSQAASANAVAGFAAALATRRRSIAGSGFQFG